MSETAPGTSTTSPESSRNPGRDGASGDTHGYFGLPPRASTSAAAVFALVFGLIALLAALTGLLAPLAVLFGLIGLVLGIVGIKAGKKPLKAGKGVAIGGLVLSILALLLGVAAIIGVATTVSNNPQILDQITNLVNGARSRLGV